MKGGMILEIQAEALDSKSSVSGLLRKALAASRKLDLGDAEEWIEHELSGYPSAADVPEYRRLRGVMRVWNPYHGWQPLHMPEEIAEIVTSMPLTESVPRLEAGAAKVEGMVQYTLPPGQANILMQRMDVPLEPALFVAGSTIVGVVESVRSHILKWALELEKRGVKGEALSFTPQEVQAASHVSYITNHIGSMTNSQLQQHSSGNQTLQVSADLGALRQVAEEIARRAAELPQDASELRTDAEVILAQARSDKPKAGILREAVKSVRTILENAAGNALSSDLLPRLIQAAHAVGLGS